MTVEFEELTLASVARQLGLRDPDAFAEAARVYNASPARVRQLGPDRAMEEVNRGTGRTTTTMIHALIAMLRGEQVFVITENNHSSHLFLRQLREYASRLSVDEKLILGGGGQDDSSRRTRGLDPHVKVFEDHRFP